MSVDNENRINSSEATEDKHSLENVLQDAEETLEITINKITNEAILRNPKDNKIVRLKVSSENQVEDNEDKDAEDEILPLTAEQFEDGLKRLDALGLTFSVDLFPSIISKNEDSSELIDAEEFEDIQEKYPALPREAGLVAHNTLTGDRNGLELLGGIESFERKSKIVRELVLTKNYESDFFFKHALKVPYIESIDWEVILKTHEKGVKNAVSVPYALLMLTFHNTNPRLGRLDVHRNITVAANRALIEKLLVNLTEAKLALDESEKMRDLLSYVKSSKEE